MWQVNTEKESCFIMLKLFSKQHNLEGEHFNQSSTAENTCTCTCIGVGNCFNISALCGNACVSEK